MYPISSKVPIFPRRSSKQPFFSFNIKNYAVCLLSSFSSFVHWPKIYDYRGVMYENGIFCIFSKISVHNAVHIITDVFVP